MKSTLIQCFLAGILTAGLFFNSNCTPVPKQTSTPPPVPAEENTITSPSYPNEPLFCSLENQLIADGVDAKLVHTIYQNPAVKLEPHIIAGNLARKEKGLNYGQYLTENSVSKAKAYLNENHESLKKFSKKFGTPPEIIVAILTVETWLGTYTGKYPTINVLSTMAVAGEPRVQKKIFSFFDDKNIDPDVHKQIVLSLKRREERGYRELKFLLHYLEKNRLDPLSIKGSVEGAIGIPQFMPSNIDHYGQDGDGDEVVDLFNHADAIASVACFLHEHKWKKARKEEAKKKVLLCYNRSIYYVDTVWALAEQLK